MKSGLLRGKILSRLNVSVESDLSKILMAAFAEAVDLVQSGSKENWSHSRWAPSAIGFITTCGRRGINHGATYHSHRPGHSLFYLELLWISRYMEFKVEVWT